MLVDLLVLSVAQQLEQRESQLHKQFVFVGTVYSLFVCQITIIENALYNLLDGLLPFLALEMLFTKLFFLDDLFLGPKKILFEW